MSNPHSAAPSRIAIVTGAASGIGYAVAERLARDAVTVVMLDRDGAQLEQKCLSLRKLGRSAEFRQVDLGDDDAVSRVLDDVFESFGRIQYLVNCAGVGIEKPFVDLTAADWDRVMGVNLRATFLVSRLVSSHMAANRTGSIVHIASIDALGTGGQAAPYSASKSGLLGLNRSMATELGRYGVRVNCVSPGFVDTPFDDWSAEAAQYLRSDFRRTPLRRIVQPHEVAASVAFLLSEEASAITGTNLVVDGGLTADWYSVETVPGYSAVTAQALASPDGSVPQPQD